MTKLKVIKNFFKAPFFEEDPEKNQKAELLNAILLFMIFSLAILLPIVLSQRELPTMLKIVDLSIFAFGLILRYWLFRGEVKWASFGLVAAGWIFINFAIIALGTINTPTTTAFLFFIVITGILFDRNGVHVSVFISMISVVFLTFAEKQGWLSGRIYPVEYGYSTIYLVIFMSVGGLSHYTRHVLNKALDRANQEIAARKISEVFLRESEERFRSLFEQTHDAVFIADLQGKFTAANQRAVDMLGFSLPELLQLNYLDVTADSQLFTGTMDLLLSGRIIPHYELNVKRKDGTLTPVEIYVELVRDAVGQPRRIQVVARDISARKYAESVLLAAHTELEHRVRERTKELQAANLELEKASRAKDDFMAAMSHELRTPLTGILGISEVLQLPRFGSLSEKQLKGIQNIEKSGKRLLEVVNNVLDFTRLQSGKAESNSEICLLDAVCRSALREMEPLAEKKRQQTHMAIAPQNITLWLDELQLRKMLIHLLKNANKFTPDGGEFGIEVTGSSMEEKVSLTVWDTGIGIDRQDQSRLFQPFVQLDSSLARQYEGTGLGLALVRLMAELNGGTVNVESAPGRGSRFTLTFPWKD